jgi:hypothetical protein
MRIVRHGAVLASALASWQMPVHAEIYTYVDPQGRVNVSNIAPPDGARVTKVVHEAPPNPYNDAAREAAQRAEMQSLAQRVDQLQQELQLAARQPAPQPPQVIVVSAPAPTPAAYAPYVADFPAAPAYPQNCAYGWNGCDLWWGSAFAPYTTFVYVPTGRGGRPTFHGGRDGGRDGHGNGNRGGPVRRPPMKAVAYTHP